MQQTINEDSYPITHQNWLIEVHNACSRLHLNSLIHIQQEAIKRQSILIINN